MGQSHKALRFCATVLLAVLLGVTPFYAAASSNAAQAHSPAQRTSDLPGVLPAQSDGGGDDGSQSYSTTSSASTQGNNDSGSSSTDQYTQTSNSSSHTGGSDSGGDSGEGLQYQFTMVAASGQQSGTGKGGIGASEEGIFIGVSLNQMVPDSRFTLVLVVNGSGHPVGNFTTDRMGQAEIKAGFPLRSGSYALGLSVYSSTSGTLGPLVLTSSPATISLAIGSAAGRSSTSSSESDYQSSQTETIFPSQTGQEDDIHSAIQSGVIPAVIRVGAGGIDYSVLDSNFTLFVGALQTGGLQITISAINGTTPRVLLVNLTSPQLVNLQPGSLGITFDGAQVQQASSVSQVISPQPGSGPLFVLISASTGYQLLILIPHFSTHVIQILPTVVSAVLGLWSLDGATLVLSLAVVSFLFLAVYARRARPVT